MTDLVIYGRRTEHDKEKEGVFKKGIITVKIRKYILINGMVYDNMFIR